MRRINSKILGAVVALVASAALAADVTISWEAPSTRVDGSLLDPSEISKYTVVCGDKVTDVSAESGNFSTTQADILPGYGTYDCYMTVVDINGLESDPSESFQVSWIAKPNPPSNIIIFIGN